jgi:hypothetical protein
MKPVRTLAVSFLLSGLFLAGPHQESKAALLPLFSFSQANPGAKDFSYNDAAGTFMATGSVSFNGLGGGLPTGTYMLDLTGHAVGPAIGGGGPGTFQPVAIDSFTFTQSTTGDVLTINTTGTPPVLLALTATTASISATDNGNAGNQLISFLSTLNGGQNLNGNPPGYPGANARDWVIGLSGVDTGFSVDAGTGNFNSFSAVISGNGDFTPTVPEPGTVSMVIGIGLSGGLLARRRMRRR